MSIELLDPMNTTEFRVEHAINNLIDAASEIDSLRRSNEGRAVLVGRRSINDLELTRDRLSRVLDDIRGVS